MMLHAMRLGQLLGFVLLLLYTSSCAAARRGVRVRAFFT